MLARSHEPGLHPSDHDLLPSPPSVQTRFNWLSHRVGKEIRILVRVTGAAPPQKSGWTNLFVFKQLTAISYEI